MLTSATATIWPPLSIDSLRALIHSGSAPNVSQAFSRAPSESNGIRYVRLGMFGPNSVLVLEHGMNPAAREDLGLGSGETLVNRAQLRPGGRMIYAQLEEARFVALFGHDFRRIRRRLEQRNGLAVKRWLGPLVELLAWRGPFFVRD